MKSLFKKLIPTSFQLQILILFLEVPWPKETEKKWEAVESWEV